MARKLEAAVQHLDSIAEGLRDFYVYDNQFEEYVLQVEPRKPRPLSSYPPRGTMTVEQKAKAISQLGQEAYLSLPY